MRAFGHRIVAWHRRSDASLYIAAAVLTTVLTALATQLWLATWSIPFEYATGDATLISAHFKTVGETGWFEVQHLLGAPGGQIYYDWFVADNLHFMWADVLDAIFRNPFVAENVYYIIGFPLAALSATYFLRVVGLSKPMAVVMATLFAIAPYHFIRGEHHLWFGSYYCIPLALVIVYRALDGQSLWGRREGSRFARGILTGRGAVTAISIALSATASSYFSVFAILLLACTGLIALIRTHAWRRFWGAVIAAVLIAVVMLINLAPPLIYSAVNGTNSQAVVREPGSSVTYAFRLTSLFLPMPGYRIPLLSQFQVAFSKSFGGAGGPPLGLVAAIGFIAAIGMVVYSVTGRFRSRPGGSFRNEARRGGLYNLSTLVIIGSLISTVGGFSLIVAMFTSDLRGWDRMSIFLSLFCVGIAGLLFDLAFDRYLRDRRLRVGMRPIIAAVLSLLIVGVGYFDQTAPAVAVPHYASNLKRFRNDAQLVSSIEASVPKGSQILQLPYFRFPEESSKNGAIVNDQLMPYLHSTTLRWSGGGIKGRPLVEWQGALGRLPVSQLLASASCANFAGVLVDTKAYGRSGAATVRAIQSELGAPTATADSGRYRYFGLGAAAAAASAALTTSQCASVGTLTTHAVYAFGSPDYRKFGFTFLPALVAGFKPNITLENPTKQPISLQVSFTINFPTTQELRIKLPDGRSDLLVPQNGVYTATENVTVAPGTSTLPITLASGASFSHLTGIERTMTFTNVQAVDPRLANLLALVAPASAQPLK
jgi:phosphoglycerol transferase